MENSNHGINGWMTAAGTMALPATYIAHQIYKQKAINPLTALALAAAGYALPKALMSVYARDNEFAKEIDSNNNAANFAAGLAGYGMPKTAMIEELGKVVGKGVKYGAEAVGGVAKSLVMKAPADASLGEKLVRPIALAGAGVGAYAVGKNMVNNSRTYNYGDYEKNLVNRGYISPDQMSRSGFENMVKTALLKRAGVLGTAMNIGMGVLAVKEGAAAMKKINSPVGGAAIQESATFGGAGGRMNNF